jgi:hypothetical protein
MKNEDKLKRISKELVLQGFDHKDNITEYFKIMIEAARNEFTEDNLPTSNKRDIK